MFYRAHQFIRAIFPRITSSDINWVSKNLPPKAFELFLQQSPADQRHAIDVALSIIEAKYPLRSCDFQNLITAALLHDCGKSVVHIRLWHRVYIVLTKKMPQFLWSYLERGDSVFSFPLKVDARHAQWGERLVNDAGLNSDVCCLIRKHHSPTTDLGLILEKADNLN